MHLEYTLQWGDVCLRMCYSLCDLSSQHLYMHNLVFSENCSRFLENLERLKEMQN